MNDPCTADLATSRKMLANGPDGLKTRCDLEQGILERDHALEAMNRQQQMLRRLLSLHERERKLIAFEIHDGLVQQVTGAKMLFEGFRRAVAQKPGETWNGDAWKTFEVGLRSLEQSIVEARRLIAGLRPSILEESGLVAAIEYLVYEFQKDAGQCIEFELQGVGFRLAPMQENAVYRIVQECVTNAVRHSRSDHIRVRLRFGKRHIQIGIRDWGVGFSLQNVPENHFGLRGIHERARLFGGNATVRTAHGRGVHVLVKMPILKPASAGTVTMRPEDAHDTTR